MCLFARRYSKCCICVQILLLYLVLNKVDFLSTKFNTSWEPRFYDLTTVPLLSMFCDTNYHSPPGSLIGASLTLGTLTIKIRGGRMLLTMFPRATRLNITLTFTKGEHVRTIRHKFLNQAHVEFNLIIVLLEIWNSICFCLNLKVKLLSEFILVLSPAYHAIIFLQSNILLRHKAKYVLLFLYSRDLCLAVQCTVYYQL